MSKILKTAAVVVGVAALVVTGVGLALGPAAAAAAGSAGIGSLSIAGLGTALTIGAGVLSLAAGLTAKRAKTEEYQRSGSPDEFVLDPEAGAGWWTPVGLVHAVFSHEGGKLKVWA